MAVTPSERHSGLAVRLSRYRRNDPGITSSAQDFMPWIGFNAPSVTAGDMESVVVELPEYDLRRLMTARVPLCCLNAFGGVDVSCVAVILWFADVPTLSEMRDMGLSVCGCCWQQRNTHGGGSSA